MRWAVEAGAHANAWGLDVVINDASGRCAAMAAVNAHATAEGKDPDPSTVPPPEETPDAPDAWPSGCRAEACRPGRTFRGVGTGWQPVTVRREPAGALLHSESFDFVHLDPLGSVAPLLDAAFSRAPHGSVLSVAAADTAALFGIYPAVARRHYGVEIGGGGAACGSSHPARPPWFKELGVRVLLGAAARAAARHDRGVTPLLCAAAEPSTVQVVVRVRRGGAAADKSIDASQGIGPLWHCELCDAAGAGMEGRPCAHADALGPGWLGPLGDEAFLRDMAAAARGETPKEGDDAARAVARECLSPRCEAHRPAGGGGRWSAVVPLGDKIRG